MGGIKLRIWGVDSQYGGWYGYGLNTGDSGKCLEVLKGVY